VSWSDGKKLPIPVEERSSGVGRSRFNSPYLRIVKIARLSKLLVDKSNLLHGTPELQRQSYDDLEGCSGNGFRRGRMLQKFQGSQAILHGELAWFIDRYSWHRNLLYADADVKFFGDKT
jgi:hypothetical protein